LIFIWLLIPISCQKTETILSPPRSNFVTQTIADKIAKNFHQMYYEGVDNREIVEQVAAAENGIPYFYVYNYKGGGFLVLSAEYNDAPILAHNLQGSFSMKGEISPGLGVWMIETRNRIDAIRKDSTNKDRGFKRLWTDLTDIKVKTEYKRTDLIKDPSPKLNTRCDEAYQDCYWDDYCSTATWTTSTKGPLLTTHWGQSCGYNAQCPVISGGPCGRALTGCVATAMAQVMRFNQFPNQFTYTSMPNWSGTSSTATLMSECGLAVGMNYGATASGANAGNIESALEWFGYSTNAWYRDYARNEVIGNINANHPVILTGFTAESCFLWWCWGSGSGHAWVCDGVSQTLHPCYNGYYYLNMNWGWDGTADGWFYGDRVKPTSNLDFQYQRKMVINIYQ
jgi:Peptidase C10 family/Spi protease inhibitor